VLGAEGVMIAMFENDDWKLATEDTRLRQNAIVAFIYSSNNQVLDLSGCFPS
jgi:hypothetical protein